ncbi:MAG: nifR3/Smm1 family protein [Osedax symbiont Rs2]|nr:MAG: nifR3/Smm1 family protein [Osedax symbiont Rs2]
MAKIMLAPMEGVVDANMRDLLTRIGGIDLCVTEFIRISGQSLPNRDLLKKVPELLSPGCSTNNVPVIVQFLGCDPQLLAHHAQKAAELGATGIDLNFGCPSKTVNKHRGGAVLLDEPETIHRIVATVRSGLSAKVTLSAKMRLGNKDKLLAVDNAQAIETAGASSLVVHARTKVEGYRPPAHWQWIHKIKESVTIPVVANGDIWNWQDYQQCRDVSGCDDVMIGRGLLADPALALTIKQRLRGDPVTGLDWAATVQLIIEYYQKVQLQLPPPFVSGRGKQWLNMMRKQNPKAQQLFEKIKKVSDLKEIDKLLDQQLQLALASRL